LPAPACACVRLQERERGQVCVEVFVLSPSLCGRGAQDRVSSNANCTPHTMCGASLLTNANYDWLSGALFLAGYLLHSAAYPCMRAPKYMYQPSLTRLLQALLEHRFTPKTYDIYVHTGMHTHVQTWPTPSLLYAQRIAAYVCGIQWTKQTRTNNRTTPRGRQCPQNSLGRRQFCA